MASDVHFSYRIHPDVTVMERHDPDLHRHILECLPIGVYVVDRQGKIIFWNSGAERITGYLRQDV